MSLIKNLYGPFFDLHNWQTVLTSGQDWMIILSLILIECLLSVDNAIVLAAQTQKLPTKKEQEKSLFYGIWGAYIFRFLLIGLGSYLINFWEIKVIGAAYLMYLSVKHFWGRAHPHKEHSSKKKRKPILPLFWSVVISIEAMDVVFSIDSILASLAISPNPVIVLIGGLVGILAMRGVAEIIMRLLEIVPELEVVAYGLIALIAVKLFLTIPAIDIEIPAVVFGAIVLLSILGAIIVNRIKNNKAGK
ncbi:TerC family protein [Ligilactobacillus acidipiscis]|uniref:TerC faamily membrane protein n=2 Tax=Ligilactobacillus acidipiscis TaxID=89059 RepID=A0A0R2K2L4_9LACO|nr:TerC family protein [Ligilactobacillus acidipiscis]KRN83857.1 TerC faamily membrane protein [Ligilactobacillus acidipiscis]GAW64212.1 TerC family membrane protein [Ligilactobacillus acidipiscis]GEN20731.1 membrane protein [Ligilactobacillus acidipiscis]SFV41354.1 TerC-like integral membrane protein [Ligilactobacillus acidipiscis]